MHHLNLGFNKRLICHARRLLSNKLPRVLSRVRNLELSNESSIFRIDEQNIDVFIQNDINNMNRYRK